MFRSSLACLGLLMPLMLAGCATTAADGPASLHLLTVAPSAAVTSEGRGVLLVAPPTAAAGYQSAAMAYRLTPYELRYYAANRWADAPASMIGNALVTGLESAGLFTAVLAGPAAARYDWLLSTELLRLEQDFTTEPSTVRLTARVALVDAISGKLLGARTFDLAAPTEAGTPEAGVVAANQALERLIDHIARFARENLPADAATQ